MAEPGSVWGRSRTDPEAGRASRAVQGVRMGARIAPNASPLPVVVTAQKPSDVGSVPGVLHFGQHQKREADISRVSDVVGNHYSGDFIEHISGIRDSP